MPDADLKQVLRREPELGTLFAQYHQVLMRGQSPFTIGERELIGAYVSALNGCDFCHGEHAGIAEAFGVTGGLIDDLATAPVSDKLRAALHYAGKLNREPAK